MILRPLLELTALGAALLAPFLAAHLLLLAQPPVGSRLADWLGLTIGLELGIAFTPTALACALFGARQWPYYGAAYGFAAVAPILSYRIVLAHMHHVRGDRVEAGRLGLACILFGLGLALGLVPWVLGAPLPLAAGELAVQGSVAGSPLAYAAVVGPVGLALLTAAWLGRQQHASPRRGIETVTAVALVAVVLGATLLLPRLPWVPRQVAARERRVLRAQAELVDQPRRTALAAILAGRAPALSSQPCPLSLPDGDRLRSFAAPTTSLPQLAEAAAFWASRGDVAACATGSHLGLARMILDGPRRSAVFAALDEDAWRGPWPERDVWISPAEARRRVRAQSASDGWALDATLLIAKEHPSFSAYGRSTLGEVEATLWLWSYAEQAFLCGGTGRVDYTVIDAEFQGPQASTVRDALRMRVLAIAATNLRAVVR